MTENKLKKKIKFGFLHELKITFYVFVEELFQLSAFFSELCFYRAANLKQQFTTLEN